MRSSIPAIVMIAVVTTGCWRASEHEVVVYSALDAEFSAPILEQFERERTVKVRANYDAESTKTVGLVTRIQQERLRPRCDVFWNNEILHTLRLEKEGLLEMYLSPAATSFPSNYRSPDGYWHGFAARARVLIVNTELVSEETRPRSIEDLLAPQWKGKVGVAKPLFGTTATHACVLFAYWGPEKAEAFFRDLKDNSQTMSGNKQVALAVGRGELAFGLTDTDDAVIEKEAGKPIAIIYPDQHEGGMGTLFIPNTLAIIRGAPHADEARALIDYLLRGEVEAQLAAGPSAQFPVNRDLHVKSRVAPEIDVRWMEADFAAAAEQWDSAGKFLRETFATTD
jgi:iron(III) transport system substrate-binding protein